MRVVLAALLLALLGGCGLYHPIDPDFFDHAKAPHHKEHRR